MRQSLIVSTEKSRGIINGQISMFYQLVTPQPIIDPDSGYVFHGKHKSLYKNDSTHEDWTIQFCKDFAPYQVGCKVYLREPWMDSPNGGKNYWGDIINNGYEYLATASEQFIEEWPKHFRPASTMPREAARTWLEITQVQCVPVWDILHQKGTIKRRLGSDGQTEKELRKSFYEMVVGKYGRKIEQGNTYVFLYDFKIIKND